MYLKKYLTVYKVSFSERLVYRFNFLAGVFIRFLPMISTVFLWKAVFAARDGAPIEQYSFVDMISYYVLIMVARSFSSMPGLARTLSQEIRDGELNKYLVRPVNYIGYLLTLRVAHKTTYFLTCAIPYTVIIFFIIKIGYFAPWPGWDRFCVFLLALVLAFMMGFLINMIVGLIGFWFLEVNTFLFIYMMIEYFCNGHMIPLDIMPHTLSQIFMWMPFHYQAFFPVSVYLNRYTSDELITKFAIEGAWIVGLFVIVCWLYRKGLRRYGAYGG